jgi:transketolase
MENNAAWHGAAPNEEQYNQAIAELDAKIAELEARL